MDQKKTGSFLRKLRKEKGYTQEGLAESGVTESIASVCAGFAYGILATAVLYTSRHMRAIFDWKRKVFRRGRTMR